MSTLIYTIPYFGFNEVSTSFSYPFIGGKVNTTQKPPQKKRQNPVVNKQRILTYFRNELHVLNQEEIAYVYIENSITYVVDMDGKRRVSNKSLEIMYKDLGDEDFFKANRQVIVSANAIKKVIKIGNCKLKVETNPESEKVIIVGKNKVASFKRWLKA